jgi:cytochrome o ubiquinol oxidase subunit I
MLGKLSWAAIPFNEPLPIISMAVVLIVILAVLALVTVKGWWPYLWREWLTSVSDRGDQICYGAPIFFTSQPNRKRSLGI